MSATLIASEILKSLIERIGQQGWLRLSDADRIVVQACCLDAAELQLSLLTSGNHAGWQDLLRREKAHVSAQLANVAAANQLALQSTLWDVASQLLVRVGTALVTV